MYRLSTLAVSLDSLKADFDRRRSNKASRDAAKAVLRNFKQQEADDLSDLYAADDAPGQKKPARVVILDPVKEGVSTERPSEAPAIKAPRRLVGYRKTQLTLVADPNGATLTDDPTAEGQKVDAWEPIMTDQECELAAIRRLVSERQQYGPVDAWVVYGSIAGKRTSMLVVGRLSDLRHYWPDSMTRRRLKRAGVDIKALGNPLQITRYGV